MMAGGYDVNRSDQERTREAIDTKVAVEQLIAARKRLRALINDVIVHDSDNVVVDNDGRALHDALRLRVGMPIGWSLADLVERKGYVDVFLAACELLPERFNGSLAFEAEITALSVFADMLEELVSRRE